MGASKRPLLALVLAGLAGCSSSKIQVAVDSTPETNGGKPFYVVVRAVEQATYVTDTYDAIAAKVFANPPDPSVLRSEVVFPGKTAKVECVKPESLPIGVYFLFTQPGQRWKTARA